MENTKTFDIGLEEAEESAVNLTDQMLVLRLALGKLRVAISDAAAPFAAVLVPAFSKAVFWAIRTVKAVGKVVGALLGVRVTTDSVEPVAWLHNRLPRFLTEDEITPWLTGTPDEARELLHPTSMDWVERLSIREVSREVGNVRNDHAGLLD